MDNISISALSLGLALGEKKERIEFEYKEPETLATKEAAALEKAHKLNFELINPYMNLNSGRGSQSFTSYNWQPIYYPECAIISQNPLMRAVLNILSNLPFQGQPIGFSNDTDDKFLAEIYDEFDVRSLIKDTVRGAFEQGGHMLYLDFDGADPTEPLNMEKADWTKFRALRHVEPIYCAATIVNTQNPIAEGFMEPEEWLVAGMGRVHHSRFIKVDENVQSLFMRPLSMYFGFPLTHLIKGEIANASASGFQLSQLLARFRNLYFYTPDGNYAKSYSKIIERLKNMVRFMSNTGVTPMKQTERMEQLVAPMTGLKDVVEALLLIISVTVQLPLLSMMDSNKAGLSGGSNSDLNIMNTRLVEIRERHKKLIDTVLRIYASAKNKKWYEGVISTRLTPLAQSQIVGEAQAEMQIAGAAKALGELGASDEYLERYLSSHGDVKFNQKMTGFIKKPEPVKKPVKGAVAEKEKKDGLS